MVGLLTRSLMEGERSVEEEARWTRREGSSTLPSCEGGGEARGTMVELIESSIYEGAAVSAAVSRLLTVHSLSDS